MKIPCDHCGKELNKKPSSIKKENYCDKVCRHSAKYTILKCGICEKEFEKLNTTILENNFCSRSCSSVFTSKRMTEMNIELNPDRMIPATRSKLREARLKMPSGNKSYRKFHGVHIHRIIAEKMIGRKLKPEEVVHHIDGDNQNNHPLNLMVMENQAAHVLWHHNDKYHPWKNYE